MTTNIPIKSLSDLELEASAVARQARGQMTPNLYVEAGATKMTPERAYAQALEANPELYEQFRNRHNANDLVRRLEAAGIQFVQR